jgi:outer membrane protein OmpA-like peptidoglycan-associated protein
MSRLRLLGPFVLLALGACAQPENYVVRLDTGAPSALVVTTAGGAVALDAPGQAVNLEAPSRAPAPAQLSDEDVRRIWAAALAHEPPAPVSFVLHFRLASTALTPDSRALLPEVLDAVRTRPAPEVAIAGFTDRAGSANYNLALGLRRARAVAREVEQAGVPATEIDVKSYGAAQPLVEGASPLEPKNRRVEVTVR